MKNTFILTALLLIGQFASAGEILICKVPQRDQDLILEKIKDLKPGRNEDERGVYKASLWTTELPGPSLNVEGIATTSDVHLIFQSDDKKFLAHIYLDGLESQDAGFLILDKKEFQISDCRINKK